MTDYTVYDLENDGHTAKQKMTDTQVIVKSLKRRAEGTVQTTYFTVTISFPLQVYSIACTKIINCCGAAGQIINVGQAVTVRC